VGNTSCFLRSPLRLHLLSIQGIARGLNFPGEQSPKQSDFAYFAFTVGTSFAVSDVDVTSEAMRRATLGHQILSFFYNTAILATVISMATG
jgi:uncharacterized membrane protein